MTVLTLQIRLRQSGGRIKDNRKRDIFIISRNPPEADAKEPNDRKEKTDNGMEIEKSSCRNYCFHCYSVDFQTYFPVLSI